MKKRVNVFLSAVLSFALLLPAAAQASEVEPAGTGVSSGTVFQTDETNIRYATAAGFSDVSASYWAKDEIDYLVKRNIIKGYSNGKFGIKDAVRRDHAALILARALGVQNETAPNPGFSDISTTYPSYNAIAVLTKYGVFSKSAKFNPTGKVTRAQMSKMLAEGFAMAPAYAASFKDVKSTDWFYEYALTLGSAGIAGGNNGYFKPNTAITRTEFSVFVARALENRFRTGVQVEIQGAQHESDGRIKMSLTLYNNSGNRVFDIKGKYNLYAGDTLAASMAASRPFTGVTLNPNQQKAVTFYFSVSEVKQRTALQNLSLDFEHEWSYYQ
ncbi:hypothetical protein BTO30_16280 [Domibacillus antri]|uniref:SLH domain-containing protein n=1 Tax=Domibacillus antri TaxID=1714264 RepID=A0A1Q8Q1I8_9BACI|nr:S-layer homology domain-containing protein [Domibacillus antri]OLN21187.1 hypothetical protein BTO30_16280 [Domibacillus antri]